MNGVSVLVTGAAGLVGSHLVQRLFSEGAQVTAAYHLRKPVVQAQKYERCDLTDYDDCLKVTKGMEVVFISAARTFGVKMMKESPTAAILPNHKIVLGLLQACAVNRVKTIILISSTTVYPLLSSPIKENDLDLNTNPYDLYYHVGWANRYFESAAAGFSRTYGMNVLLVRPSSIYGPFDNFETDKSHVIPALIKRALDKEQPFIVWGRKDVVRDFIYVDDVVDDILALYKRGCFGEPFNLAHGRTITIEETVKTILEICGHATQPVFDCSRPEGIPCRAFSVTKLEERLGKRRRTPFREGLKKTVAWYKSQQDNYS